jgi:hypothetical protein
MLSVPHVIFRIGIRAQVLDFPIAVNVWELVAFAPMDSRIHFEMKQVTDPQ